MLSPGSIYFIKNFQFEDGGEPSNKLLIVLFIDDANSLLVKALPTSNQKVPNDKLNHGCTSNDNFSFFMFAEGREVGVK